MRVWKNVELSRERYEKFRSFLKENDIKYEPSGCGNLTHVEVYVNSEEEEKCNHCLEII